MVHTYSDDAQLIICIKLLNDQLHVAPPLPARAYMRTPLRKIWAPPVSTMVKRESVKLPVIYKNTPNVHSGSVKRQSFTKTPLFIVFIQKFVFTIRSPPPLPNLSIGRSV